ncbi:type 1 fimbrial protein [Citrobacter sedlakii]|nr:type 1 fimbrial protein [Citrobacter sedlakii]
MPFPGTSYASDPVEIEITGTIVASPCEVSTDSKEMTIDLGNGVDLQTSTLNAAGSGSPWVNFNVSVENCPPGTSSVTATFHGTADSADPDSLYTSTGDATNVAVQLQGVDGSPYGNGKTSTLDIASATEGKPTWALQARAYSKNGGATPGSIAAHVTMTFTYQ